MKKIVLSLVFLNSILVYSQFTVHIKTSPIFSAKEAILYSLVGSKDVIVSKVEKKNNQWDFNMPQNYMGMLKVYFPETNSTINMISENKNIILNFDSQNNKITAVQYQDEANKLMEAIQDVEQKKEVILPALYQMQEYYKPNTEFRKSIEKEIERLSSKQIIDKEKHPFISYYNSNYNKYLVKSPTESPVSQEELQHFIVSSNEYLESSSLLRPILLSFLNSGAKSNVDVAVDQLLNKLNIETPRGQVVLSELIDLFDVYGMSNLKNKYLTEANNLKCTITDRLAKTIKVNENTKVGAIFPDYTFNNPIHTTSSSLKQIKAKNKIIVFWSSTCSHCETELPKLLPIYSELKKKNIEVVGFSLDNDLGVYKSKASVFPWINTSELKGWNSSFVETYNVHATPTYFILDENDKIVEKPDHVQDVINYFNLKKAL